MIRFSFFITKIRVMIVTLLTISIVCDDDVFSFFDGFDVSIQMKTNSNLPAIQQENSSVNENENANANGNGNDDDDVDDDAFCVDGADDDGDDVCEIFSSFSSSYVLLWTMLFVVHQLLDLIEMMRMKRMEEEEEVEEELDEEKLMIMMMMMRPM